MENKLVPDENTVYHVASLTKSFTAAAAAMLVKEDLMSWDNPVVNILPDFRHLDHTIQTEATILDFLSHRTGLTSKDSLWSQNGADLLLKPNDLYSTISYQEVVHPFRSSWLYNNLGYNLAAERIEKVSGRTWAGFLSERILRPLGLEGTTTERYPNPANLAKGYMSSANGLRHLIESPRISDGTLMQGAIGIKSTVKDLLTYYNSFLLAAEDRLIRPKVPISNTPFKGVEMLLTGHVSVNLLPNYKQYYGAGWMLAELPSPLGAIRTNGICIPEMPVVGKSCQRQKIWYHNGCLSGSFSSVHVLPDTHTAMVVLVNSLAKSDCADWIGQMLVETIMNNPEKNDYEELPRESAESYSQMWENLKTELDNSRTSQQDHRPSDEYTGKYYNVVGNFFIEVAVVERELHFSCQGLPTQRHRLYYYGTDTFHWLLTEDESVRRGRFPDLDIRMYIFVFEMNDLGRISTLRWLHDLDVPNGEIFKRKFDS